MKNLLQLLLALSRKLSKVSAPPQTAERRTTPPSNPIPHPIATPSPSSAPTVSVQSLSALTGHRISKDATCLVAIPFLTYCE